jgi:hypothetical protein
MNGLVVALIILGGIALVFVIAVALIQGRRRTLDRRREQAGEHRELARQSELEAQQRQAEADERAGRAGRVAAVGCILYKNYASE